MISEQLKKLKYQGFNVAITYTPYGGGALIVYNFHDNTYEACWSFANDFNHVEGFDVLETPHSHYTEDQEIIFAE